MRAARAMTPNAGLPRLRVVRTRFLLIWALLLLVLVTACTPPGLPEPIAPTGPIVTPATPPPAGTVVIGLDGLGGRIAGFNPYAIADFSLAAQAVASLVLPSTFVVAADGSTTPDADVIDAAAVTSTDPFTVTYTVDRKASWSDGTPITAEDFSYLRDQLLVQPGTVNPAGYQLITAIRSRDAGKTVEVQFSAPFPDWRTLFSPLLPSHLMKDFPGGWAAALTTDIPVSANRYRMTAYDAVTGQVTLARNDKYWAMPPEPAAVILRLGDPTDLLAAFGRGDVQALWLAPSGSMATSLDKAVPAERRAVVSTAASVQLVFNTTAGPTADPSVRAAMAAAIAPTVVAADLTGGWLPGARAVHSQVRLPSQVGGSGSAAPVVTDDPAVARTDLATAGYVRGGLYAAKAGQVLRLTLGYPSGDSRLAAAARTIARQLGTAGIEVSLLADAATSLVETRMATGSIDLALLTVPRGTSDAASAASAFGCPISTVLGIGSTVTSTPPPTEQTGSTTTQAAPAVGSAGQSTGPAPTTGNGTPATGDQTAVRTGNLSGYCEPGSQRVLADALSGRGTVQTADPGLWAELPVLPLVQRSAVFAVGDSLTSVLDGPRAGWAWTGPLSGLSGWPIP